MKLRRLRSARKRHVPYGGQGGIPTSPLFDRAHNFETKQQRQAIQKQSGHARAEYPGEVRAHRILVVLPAERPPADMLTRRVVLKSTYRVAAGDRAVCTPLAVALAASVQLTRPMVGSAVLRIGEAETTCHPGNALVARRGPAGSFGILSTLLEKGVGRAGRSEEHTSELQSL